MSLKSTYILFLLISASVYVEAQDGTKISISYGQNHFINKAPFTIKDSIVCFFFRGHQDAKTVLVSGSFNNWVQEGIPFIKTDSGWITNIKLGSGKHWYKLIVDAKWVLDTDNVITETNGEYINNVYYKTNVVFTLPGFNKAKNVYLSATTVNSKPLLLQMISTIKGWELPIYLPQGTYSYYFIVDGKVFADPINKDRLPDETGKINSIVYVEEPADLIRAYRSYQMSLVGYNKNEIANSLTTIGNIYKNRSDYKNAFQNFQKAATIYQNLKNYDSAGSTYLKIEQASRFMGDLSSQLSNIQKATTAFEQTKNEAGLAEAARIMGYYYLNLGQWPKAAECFEKALLLFQRVGNQVQEANTLHNIGHATGFYDISKSIEYLNRSLTLSEKIGHQRGIASNLWLLGNYFRSSKKDLETAVNYYRRAFQIFETLNNKGGMAEILLSFAHIYLDESDSILQKLNIKPDEKFAKAISDEKSSLKLYTELNSVTRQQVGILFISDTYERMGMHDSSLRYYRRWVEGENKYFNTEKQKELTRIETEYKYEKREDSLQVAKTLTDEMLEKQILLARQQQQLLELNQSQLDLANKEKDLQHVEYLKTQGDLKNEQLIKKQNEREKAILKLNQQRQWIYIAGALLLLIVASLYFIYRSRIRRLNLEAQLIKEKAEQEKKETEFQQKLADVSMSALRSQMNPHFIFNCLNSIKLYTTQNDSVAASEYLTKFSKLIRLILENSRNERITLSSELAALELYIEMEAMRFKEKLSYSFSVDKNVESDYIEIPPLLLQPYVENAIWHGLMAREDGGHISINVTMQEDKSLLEINITDNGVGREAAGALSKKIAGKHRSYGMKATTERIALINQIYKTGANVLVHDLINGKGQPAGTRVTIQIPV